MEGLKTGHGLCKEERLNNVKAMETLVSKGRRIVCGPLRCSWTVRNLPEGDRPDKALNRIAVAVPKRFFKRAVKRNLLKRRIREAYRINKDCLPQERNVDMLFVFIGSEPAPYDEIRDSVTALLEKINGRTGQ